MNFKIIFLLIVLCIIIYCLFQFFTNKKFLTKEEQDYFYKHMKIVDRVLQENNIEYFVIGGTLLGIARNGKIIPYDDDIDIGILESDVERYNTIDFSKYGYTSGTANKNICKKIFIGKGLFIDVFLFKKTDNKYMYSEANSVQIWPNEYFLETELFPLKRYDYGPIKVNGPNQLEPYCKRSWGRTWNTPTIKFSKFVNNPIANMIYILNKENKCKFVFDIKEIHSFISLYKFETKK